MSELNYLVVKMFAGEFNDYNIGHEVINMFSHDIDDEWHYLYIPPCGSINQEKAKKCNRILFFSATSFPYQYRLDAVAKINNNCFLSNEESEVISKNIKYHGVYLHDINFVVVENEKRNNTTDKKNVQSITYKIRKEDYFDTKDLGITTKFDNNKKTAFHNYMFVYNGKNEEKLNYENLDKWYFDNNIEKKLKYKKLCTIEEALKSSNNFYYEKNNFLEFIKKANDENIITSMIVNTLDKNPKLLTEFVKEIIRLPKKEQDNYNLDINIDSIAVEKIKSQQLTTKLSKNENVKDSSKNKKGIIDIYIKGEDFRFVVENKIKSGLNDIYIEDGKIQNQLNIYDYFLNCLDDAIQKCIFIFAPNYNDSFEIKGLNCSTKTINYSSLYTFFHNYENNGEYIEGVDFSYYKLLVNILAKHSRSFNEEIIQRFIDTIEESKSIK